MLQHLDNHMTVYWAGLVCSIWKQRFNKLRNNVSEASLQIMDRVK